MADDVVFQEAKTPFLPLDAAAGSVTRHVRLFRNGANQALRIPKEFELPGKEALIRRDGAMLIIEPIKPPFEKGSAAALMAVLDELAIQTGVVDEQWEVDAALLPLDTIDLGDESGS